MHTVPAPRKKKVMVVEDSLLDLQVIQHHLEKDYETILVQDPNLAVQLARTNQPDLILMDIMMPQIGGVEVCRKLKNNPQTTDIPVIFITSIEDPKIETLGFNLGAVDFVKKPFSPTIFKARIKSHLELSRLLEIKSSRLEIIRRLVIASEYRDNETGNHILRMSKYCEVLAKHYGLPLEEIEDIYNASAMHDVGKIGIPDSILRKNGRLTSEEFEIIKTHPIIGADIIGEHETGLLKVAREICIGHHEKWDGSGYPYGCKGEEISLSARIASVADVFDALTTNRPYKNGWPIGQAVEYIRSQSGISFDPEIVEVFSENIVDLLRAKVEFTAHTQMNGEQQSEESFV
ncbi:HD domain-containing phosphohydrolase [Leptospira adleri]|uniref:Two-component system response regulator n=1 Tax=Leptospira adleri TaxID=2023186 RepID=A0A2M9YTP6_9LEPT|nr:HD domain-containing phosphohydrolase [Leptospira adleri]PJZ54907.1 two-component system response regulator [Leptospira adleri]PJZ60913.1 two-component system response regulator [Leptospira adleri]TGM57734.1 response regulator [Leptospira adleri]